MNLNGTSYQFIGDFLTMLRLIWTIIYVLSDVFDSGWNESFSCYKNEIKNVFCIISNVSNKPKKGVCLSVVDSTHLLTLFT